MANFWETLDKLGGTIDDIGEVLDDVNDTYATTRHGYNAVKDSKENFDRVVQRVMSGENDADMDLALKYYERTKRCKKRTIIFCIFMIIITVVVCVFV